MSLDAHPDKALTYFSPRILERRQRLLKETRKMIAESGYENFSVRKLCERASVAQKTLYNAFQNKDRLVVLAIREAYDDFHKYTNYTTDRNTVAGILDRAVALNRQNMRVPNYIKA
ncbi:MAG: helix-turn-helix domain-containing protein, partial [Coleofasciculus sp. C2-GNP5-27]